MKYQAMVQPWAHYIVAYFLPTTVLAVVFGESLIFGFVSSVLRYHVAAHRVLERARSNDGGRGRLSVFQSAPRTQG